MSFLFVTLLYTETLYTRSELSIGKKTVTLSLQGLRLDKNHKYTIRAPLPFSIYIGVVLFVL